MDDDDFFTSRPSDPLTLDSIDLLAPVTEESTGAVAWAATRVKIARVGEADGRLILFAGGMREHAEQER